MKEGIIYPVDWESAAVAPGEIDLASLIEGWDKDIANRVIESYRKNRWPSGNLPVGLFEKRLLLSQIYFHFWWWPEKKEVNEKAFIKLKQFAQEAGVI
jgi:thiamine kinase-like enzyme